METRSPILTVDPVLIDRWRRKHTRRMLLPIALFAVAVFIAIPFPPPMGINDPLGQGVVSLALFTLGGYALWRENRWLREINRVEVTERGLYPPTKPKQKLREGEWFVPYKDIMSMEPVDSGAMVPSAYDINLQDGVTFRLNALDLLSYVGEPEVRRYEKILRVIRLELSKGENQDRASKREDIIISREKFSASTAG